MCREKGAEISEHIAKLKRNVEDNIDKVAFGRFPPKPKRKERKKIMKILIFLKMPLILLTVRKVFEFSLSLGREHF